MSGGIEFVEPDPEPEPTPGAHGRGDTALWFAAIAWTAAAVLATLAPFQRLYGSGPMGMPRRYADYLPGFAGGIDGWGGGAGAGPRFGIALVACAAICALLAVGNAAKALGMGWPTEQRRLLSGTAVAAPCLLAGVTGTIALFLAADPSVMIGWTAYSQLGQAPTSSQGYGSSLAMTVTGGASRHSWCLWLAVAAFVCAVVAALAQHGANRSERHLAG